MPQQLNILARPKLSQPRLILGFSGWMDGGDVSTGTIELLLSELSARKLAEIDPAAFNITSFPGNMEVSAMFRPRVRIEDGLIQEYQVNVNEFFYDEATDLILFRGREPNTNWPGFAECIFDLCKQFAVSAIYFIGSVAGAVPHTRQPRISSTVSHADLRPQLSGYGVRFSNYDGPASFVTHLLHECASRGMMMATLVSEIPAYVQGANPACIEAAARRLCAILGLQLSFNEMREVSETFERKVTQAVEDNDELKELIAKLEADYDADVFDNQMGDLKAWLQQKGVRLD